VLVIGDGKSDMCVSTTADFVFAKGSLAQYCQAHDIPHLRFDTLAELPALPAQLPQGIPANVANFRSWPPRNSSCPTSASQPLKTRPSWIKKPSTAPTATPFTTSTRRASSAAAK